MTTNLLPEGQEVTIELTTWIIRRLVEGAPPDHVTAELVSGGWTWETARQIVRGVQGESPGVTEQDNTHSIDYRGFTRSEFEHRAPEAALLPTAPLVNITWEAAFKIATAIMVLPVLVGIVLGIVLVALALMVGAL